MLNFIVLRHNEGVFLHKDELVLIHHLYSSSDVMGSASFVQLTRLCILHFHIFSLDLELGRRGLYTKIIVRVFQLISNSREGRQI